jgi:hypothetical protein
MFIVNKHNINTRTNNGVTAIVVDCIQGNQQMPNICPLLSVD